MSEIFAGEERFFREKTCDAAVLQAAVIEAASVGGSVRIPRINPRTGRAEWRIDRAVSLPSNVTVILENAVLVQETGTFDRIFTAEPGTENIAVIGEGAAMLSGGEKSRLNPVTQNRFGLPSVEQNAMMSFPLVHGIVIKNLTLSNMRWNALVFTRCEDIEVKNVCFESVPRVLEESGLRFRGCKNVKVENLTGRTGASTVIIESRDGESSSAFSLRNIMTDPARGTAVQIETSGNGTVSDVTVDTVIDSSDYFEKARTTASLLIGTADSLVVPDVVKRGTIGTIETAPEAIKNVYAKNLYSRSVHAIEVLQPFSDSRIEHLVTFGDNIYAIGTRSEAEMELKNVVFDGVFYGAGSKPNNLNAFISRMAKGAAALKMKKITGYTVERLYTQEEEA